MCHDICDRLRMYWRVIWPPPHDVHSCCGPWKWHLGSTWRLLMATIYLMALIGTLGYYLADNISILMNYTQLQALVWYQYDDPWSQSCSINSIYNTSIIGGIPIYDPFTFGDSDDGDDDADVASRVTIMNHDNTTTTTTTIAAALNGTSPIDIRYARPPSSSNNASTCVDRVAYLLMRLPSATSPLPRLGRRLYAYSHSDMHWTGGLDWYVWAPIAPSGDEDIRSQFFVNDTVSVWWAHNDAGDRLIPNHEFPSAATFIGLICLAIVFVLPCLVAACAGYCYRKRLTPGQIADIRQEQCTQLWCGDANAPVHPAQVHPLYGIVLATFAMLLGGAFICVAMINLVKIMPLEELMVDVVRLESTSYPCDQGTCYNNIVTVQYPYNGIGKPWPSYARLIGNPHYYEDLLNNVTDPSWNGTDGPPVIEADIMNHLGVDPIWEFILGTTITVWNHKHGGRELMTDYRYHQIEGNGIVPLVIGAIDLLAGLFILYLEKRRRAQLAALAPAPPPPVGAPVTETPEPSQHHPIGSGESSTRIVAQVAVPIMMDTSSHQHPQQQPRQRNNSNGVRGLDDDDDGVALSHILPSSTAAAATGIASSSSSSSAAPAATATAILPSSSTPSSLPPSSAALHRPQSNSSNRNNSATHQPGTGHGHNHGAADAPLPPVNVWV